MKTSLIIVATLGLFLNTQASETEKTLKTKPEKVIVYKNGAQIFRQMQTNLVAGENKLVFEWLEEGVSANSIQVGGNGNFIITESKKQRRSKICKAHQTVKRFFGFNRL